MSRTASSRPAVRLAGFYAAAFLVTGVQLPFWPVWLASRGLTAREIGLLLAAAIWTKVIAAPAISALADRSGEPRVLMGGLAAVALAGYLALSSTTRLWVLLPLNLIALTAQSALMPLGDTVALGASRSQGLDYGRVRVWGSVSFILGSLGGGAVLAATTAERVLQLVIGASTLLFAATLAIPTTSRPARLPSDRGPIRRIATDPQFWFFVATASALQASHQVYYGFGTLYWRSLGFSETTIGWLWAEGVVAEILLFWLGKRFLARLGPAGLMMLGGGAGIVRWSLAGVLPSLPFVAALQLLHGLTFGASHLGAMHFLSRAVPPHAAAGAQTLYAAVSSGFGGGLVMLAAGALYEAYGGGAFAFMALLSAAGLIGSLGLQRARQP